MDRIPPQFWSILILESVSFIYATLSENKVHNCTFRGKWLVTGAVPSRVQLLYPWHRVHICTLVICTLRDQFCTCGDNFVPLFNSTKMDPSKRVQNWL